MQFKIERQKENKEYGKGENDGKVGVAVGGCKMLKVCESRKG